MTDQQLSQSDHPDEAAEDAAGRSAGDEVEPTVLAEPQQGEPLRESEELFRLLVESATDYAIFAMDTGGIINSWNTGAERLFGWTIEEAVGQPCTIIFTPEDRAADAPEQEMKAARETGRALDERFHLRKDGSRFYVSGILSPLYRKGRLVGYVKIARDLTERRDAELQLNALLQQRKTLLKEVHHRVKNNLQAITNLLYLQAGTISEEPVRAILRAAQDRIKSIALVHEKLYQTENLAQINLPDYLASVARQLIASYRSDPESIVLHLRVEEIELDVDTAVPLGIIVNELISNALKHAFPPGRSRPEGQVDELGIELRAEAAGRFLLTVWDNGVGLPEGLDPKQVTSLGLRLVEMLTGHMQGELRVERNGGTAYQIRFSPLVRPAGQ